MKFQNTFRLCFTKIVWNFGNVLRVNNIEIYLRNLIYTHSLQRWFISTCCNECAYNIDIKLIPLEICLIQTNSTKFTVSVVFRHAAMDIDYLPAEYCLDRSFHFLIPSREVWRSYAIVVQNIDGFKLDNEVGNGVYTVKLDPNISLSMPNYCSVFQAEVLAIYEASSTVFPPLVSRSFLIVRQR